MRIKWLFFVILTKEFYQKCTRQVYSLCVVEVSFLDQKRLYGKPNLVAYLDTEIPHIQADINEMPRNKKALVRFQYRQIALLNNCPERSWLDNGNTQLRPGLRQPFVKRREGKSACGSDGKMQGIARPQVELCLITESRRDLILGFNNRRED